MCCFFFSYKRLPNNVVPLKNISLKISCYIVFAVVKNARLFSFYMATKFKRKKNVFIKLCPFTLILYKKNYNNLYSQI